MTSEEVAQLHENRHRLCESACALMKDGQDVPKPVINCGGLCQGLRWQRMDQRDGVQSFWSDPVTITS